MTTVDVNYKLSPINGKVIVIEDEEMLRTLMTDILEEVGAECEGFSNADDALMHLLESHAQFALVIADHGLPGSVQGAELVEMIRSKWPSISAIITSGWAESYVKMPPGIKFLGKPWSIDTLVKAVSEVTGAAVVVAPPPIRKG